MRKLGMAYMSSSGEESTITLMLDNHRFLLNLNKGSEEKEIIQNLEKLIAQIKFTDRK